LHAEMLDLKADPTAKASGTVIEARVDTGRGSVATVLVQKGTLSVGDHIVIGRYSGKIRAMFDDNEKRIETAGPSTPIELLGIEALPQDGDPMKDVDSDKES